MIDTTTTPYEPTAYDRNLLPIHLGDQVVFEKDGHFVHGTIKGITDYTGLGKLLTLDTREGVVIVTADASARTRRVVTRRAA